MLLELDAGGPTTPATCGGTTVTISGPGELWDAFGDNGIDCLTAERIHYDNLFGFPVTAPATSQNLTRALQFWNDIFDAGVGTQWQTHNPAFGARMALASGMPIFMTNHKTYEIAFAGSSFYIQQCSYSGADYTMRAPFQATNNSDTSIAWIMRNVDNMNYLRVEYLPPTQTFNLVQKIAGVDTILATAVHDLTTDGTNGYAFDVQTVGAAVNVTDPLNLLTGAYVTAHLTGGPIAALIIATGANNCGFGGNNPGQAFGTH